MILYWSLLGNCLLWIEYLAQGHLDGFWRRILFFRPRFFLLHHPAALICGWVSLLLIVVKVFTFLKSLGTRCHSCSITGKVVSQLNRCTDAWLCKRQPLSITSRSTGTTLTANYNGSQRGASVTSWFYVHHCFGVTLVNSTYCWHTAEWQWKLLSHISFIIIMIK